MTDDDDEPIASGVLPIGPRSGHLLAEDDVSARFSRLFQVAAALAGSDIPTTIEAALDYASLSNVERKEFVAEVMDDLPGDGLGLAMLLPLIFVEDDPLSVASMTKAIWEAVERNQSTLEAWSGVSKAGLRGCRILVPIAGGASEIVEVVYQLEDGFRFVRERSIAHEAEVGSALLVVLDGILLEPVDASTAVADLITTVLTEARYRRESVFDWQAVCSFLLEESLLFGETESE